MGGTPHAEDDRGDVVRQQEVVAGLGRRALETDDPDELLREAAAAVVDASRADHCVVLELLPGGEEARIRAGSGWRDDPVGTATVSTDRDTHPGAALREATPVVVDDPAESDRFGGGDLLERPDVASGVAVAVGPVEAPWGVLGAYATEPDAFSTHDATFLCGVANALGSDRARRRAAADRPFTERLLESVGEGMYALDDEDRFVQVNDAFCDLTGYDREELLGARASMVHSADVNERAGELAEASTDGREEAVLEVELRRADGETIPVESRFVPYEYRDGHTGRAGIVRDVTERKRFEETLAALYDTSRELFRASSGEEVATLVVDAGTDVLDFTDVALYLRDDERGDLYPATKATEVGFMWDELPRIRPDDSTIAGHAYASGESVLEDDIRASPYFIDEETDMRAGVYAPVGEYGVVFAGSTTVGAFDDRDRRLLELLAETAEAAFARLDRERRLVESERRYRTLAENFPDGAVGLFDEELVYTAVGGALLDEIGLDPEDRVGRSVSDIHPDEFAAEIEPHFRDALSGEATSFEAEYRGRHLYATVLPVRNAEDEIHAGMLVVQDVTDRRRAERELVESEAKFRMLAENLEEIVWMATPDAEELIYVNPAFEDMWGRDRETLYDDPLSFLEAVHPDDRERVEEAFAELPDSEFDEEYRIARPAGEVRWVHSRGARVRAEDGEMDRIVGIGEDVTERKERERELERALDLLEKTERIANVGGWEIDVDTKEVFWTDHIFELLGVRSDEEPLLDEALAMYHEDDQPIVENAIDEALDAGEPFDVEARIRTDAGEVRWLRLQGEPETVDGDVVSLRGAVQDVTERTEREQRLEELIDQLKASNERLEQFAYAASHDLQEPLRMVSSYLQLIEDRYAEALDEDGEEFLAFAVDGAERMRDMIEGLLQYSRVDSRGDPLEPVDLDAVLDDVRTDLQVRIDESGAEVTSEPLPTVDGDRNQLRQLFQNLLDNAIEYSGAEPPRVHVSAERAGVLENGVSEGSSDERSESDGDEWVVSVADEGIGIDTDDGDRVFEVFQRLHSREEHPGTGIGLALCQRIVERHGGDIWVDSEPGEGATFSFTLPAIDSRA